MSNLNEQKDLICDVCHKMWQLGWVAANDGNVTAMLDDGTLLATPTGMSKSFITPDKLIRIDRAGNVLEAPQGLLRQEGRCPQRHSCPSPRSHRFRRCAQGHGYVQHD